MGNGEPVRLQYCFISASSVGHPCPMGANKIPVCTIIYSINITDVFLSYFLQLNRYEKEEISSTHKTPSKIKRKLRFPNPPLKEKEKKSGKMGI